MDITKLLQARGYWAPAGDDKDGGGGDDAGDRGDDSGEGDDSGDDKGGDGSGEEESDEEKAERERVEAEAKAAKDKDKTIPKSRFDEAVRKEREKSEAAVRKAQELQAELDASRTQVDTAKLEADIDKLEDELDKALADNDPAEKKRLRAEIRAKSTELADAKADVRSRYAIAVAVEQIRYDGLVGQLESQHPELNPEHDDYDEEVVANIRELKEAYEAAGQSSSEALKKASRLVFAAMPKKDPPADKKDDKKGEDPDEAVKRKEEAVKKALAAKGKQPPSGKDVGAASDAAGKKNGKLDVSKLNDKDFEKIEKSELARMRGDII